MVKEEKLDFLLLLALVLSVIKTLLPWVLAYFLTTFFMGLAGIRSYIVPTFLFGFFLIGFFLKHEVLPFIFKDW
jgi:hypothetical protein